MKKTNKGGRPEVYTKELSEKICELLSQGKSLRTVCKEKWCPDGATIFSWMRLHPEFLKHYEKAKQEASDALAEEILDIADESTNDYMEVERQDGSTFTRVNQENIQRARLRVDTRKWLMSKMKPKKYGEKIDVTSGDKPIPLLHVLHNDSNKEDPKSDKTN